MGCINVTSSTEFNLDASTALTNGNCPLLPGCVGIKTNAELKTAVNDAITNGTPVNDIDVGFVSDFSEVFKDKEYF